MAKIHIETLTAVHIGSGETFLYGTDIVKGKYQGDEMLALVDLRKLVKMIGTKNIYALSSAIGKGDTTESVVKRFVPNAEISDYAKRMILLRSDVNSNDTLKEQIHDGRGVPYIPGSSIKGAIRTAVMASLAQDLPDLNNKLENKSVKNLARQVGSELFGKSPQEDVFRFLQVGDAFFEQKYEVAIKMVSINEREKKGFWDDSKSQLVAAICPGDTSEFQIRFNEIGHQLAYCNKKVKELPYALRSVSSLFETINAHTVHLLETEMEYWKKRELFDDSEKVSEYLDKIEDMMEIAKQCTKGRECVLRVGYGSGWRFITGAWTEGLNDFKSIVDLARRNNKNYENYDFPKTRRVDDQCELLGFVKLTIYN